MTSGREAAIANQNNVSDFSIGFPLPFAYIGADESASNCRSLTLSVN